MLVIGICDDEEFFIKEIKECIISNLDDKKIGYEIHTYTNPKQLISDIKNGKVELNLLFLDILMEDENGVQIAEAIRNADYTFDIIFVTSSKDFLLEGYSVYPFHYLIKPINLQMISEVLNKYMKLRAVKEPVILPTKAGEVILEDKDIYYIEMLNRIIYVHSNHQTYECSMSLKTIMEYLKGDQFVRCHKSYIVNLQHVSTVRRSHTILRNNHQVPVGRAFYSGLMEALIVYV